jgi:hypothetical protein
MRTKVALNSIPRLVFGILLVSFLFSCDTSDDNNPSPIPDVRDKFVGEWKANEDCSKGIYIVNISKDPSNSARVLLQNFAGSNAIQPDTALVAASSIIVYDQVNSENWEIEGSGSYQVDGWIEWEKITLVISGSVETCSATYIKTK